MNTQRDNRPPPTSATTITSNDDRPVESDAGDFASPAAVGPNHPFHISSTRIADATTDRGLKSDSNTAGELPLGTRVGDFELIELLGRGGVSYVYRARQCSLDRVVALKVTQLDAGVGTTSGVSQEGRTMASLSHDNIVPVFAEEVHDNHRLLAMGHVNGPSLANVLDALASQASGNTATGIASSVDDILAGRSRTQFACETAREIARALVHAHAHQVLHCDVKPANILFADSGRPLLTDFNVSVRNSATDDAPVGGTLAYMSPEHLGLVMGIRDEQQAVVANSEPVDERTDVYGLGLVLFQMLTGSWPFHEGQAGTDPLQAASVLRGIRLSVTPAFPDDCRLSRSLRSIVCKCLAPIGDRYQSAADLAEDLDRYLSNRRLKFATGSSLAERVVRSWRQHRLPIIVVSLAVLVLAVALIRANRASPAELERRGSELAAAGEYELAISPLESVVERNPQLRVARFNLGIAYFKTERFIDSVAAFDEVIKSGLCTSTVYAHRCAARLAAGDQPGAESDYQSALKTMTPRERTIVDPLLSEYARMVGDP